MHLDQDPHQPVSKELMRKERLAAAAFAGFIATQALLVGFQPNPEASQRVAKDLVGIDLELLGAAGMVAWGKKAAAARQESPNAFMPAGQINAENYQTYHVPLPPAEK